MTRCRVSAGSIEASLAELDMDRYDDEEATNGGRIFGSGNPGMAFYRHAPRYDGPIPLGRHGRKFQLC